MADMEIVKQKVAAIEEMRPIDLQSAACVEALCATAAMVAEQKKELDAQDKCLKDNFKRMCAEHIQNGQGVTCYAWEQGKKMTITIRGGGMELDEKKFLDNLYAAYGETPGDMTGRAWAAFVAVSDEVEMPRVLNADKLAEELRKAERIATGIEGGSPLVTKDMVDAATSYKKPVAAASLSNVTKVEMENHVQNGWNPVFVAVDK